MLAYYVESLKTIITLVGGTSHFGVTISYTVKKIDHALRVKRYNNQQKLLSSIKFSVLGSIKGKIKSVLTGVTASTVTCYVKKMTKNSRTGIGLPTVLLQRHFATVKPWRLAIRYFIIDVLR